MTKQEYEESMKKKELAASTTHHFKTARKYLEGMSVGEWGTEVDKYLGKAATLLPQSLKFTESMRKPMEQNKLFDSEVNQVSMLMAKALGVNPTDTDLRFIRETMPGSTDTPRIRKEKLDNMEQLNQFIMEGRFRPGFLGEDFQKSRTRPTEPGAGSPPVPGKQSALPESYWGMNATAGGTVLPRSQPPMEQEGFLSDLKRRGGEFYEGLKEGATETGMGVAQTLGVGPSYEQVKQYRQDYPTTDTLPAQAGRLVSGIATDPTTYIPGGRVLKSALLGGASNMATRPSESAADTLKHGLFGSVATGAGAAMVPLKEANPIREATRKGFEDVPLTMGQHQGKKNSWAAEGIAAKQAEELTKNRLKDAGINAERAYKPVLDTKEAELTASFKRLFPESKTVTLPASEAKVLDQTVTSYREVLKDPAFIKDAPGLAKFNKLVDAGNRSAGTIKLTASDLHNAYQDIGKIPNDRMAGAIRNDLNSFIKSKLSKAERAEFDKVNKEWGALADIRKTNIEDGIIRPSSLRGDASEFVKSYGIKNPTSMFGNVWEPAAGLSGAALAAAGMPYGLALSAYPAAHLAGRVGGKIQGKVGGITPADQSMWANIIRNMPREGTESY
jgi:hypothetical protein